MFNTVTKVLLHKMIFFFGLSNQELVAFNYHFFVYLSDVFSHHQISFSNKERTNEESSRTTSRVNKTEQEDDRRRRGQKGLL